MAWKRDPQNKYLQARAARRVRKCVAHSLPSLTFGFLVIACARRRTVLHCFNEGRMQPVSAFASAASAPKSLRYFATRLIHAKGHRQNGTQERLDPSSGHAGGRVRMGHQYRHYNCLRIAIVIVIMA